MSRTLTASERSALIRQASALPKGSAERRAILAGITKQARARKLTIVVDEDRSRDGQPYVEFNGDSRYYQVRKGEWRNATGMMPLAQLAAIADMMLAGKIG
jgi:hypothetical protein